MRRVLQHKGLVSILLLLLVCLNGTRDYGVGGYSYNPSKEGKDILPVEDDIKKIIKEKKYTEEGVIRELADIKIVDTVKPDIWPVVGLITSDFGQRAERPDRTCTMR